MTITTQLIPPGPAEKYDPADNILGWLTKNLRDYGGIYRAYMYGANVYVVSDPRYIDRVLRENWQNYKKGQEIKRIGLLLGNGLMVSEGTFWKAQRRLIQPAFHMEVIGSLVGIIQKASSDLLSRWTNLAQQERSINVTREVSLWVLEIVLRTIFGQDFDMVDSDFRVLSSESARNLQFARIFRPLREVIRAVIVRRRQTATIGMDILGMLMTARDRVTGDTMPEGQLINEIITLIVAGHETTASTLNWVWYLLSQHPGVESRLSTELSSCHNSDGIDPMVGSPYLRQVLEETMRLYPPGWLMTRQALKDDYIGEYFVPAGTEVYISPYLVQRNPALWDNAEMFDPGRFAPDQLAGKPDLAHIPFSAGPRKCIGDQLARVEMQLHIMTIARHLRLRWTSGNPDELDIGVNLRCKNDLHFTGELKPPQQYDRVEYRPTRPSCLDKALNHVRRPSA